MRSAAFHDALASLFTYPGADYAGRVRACGALAPEPSRGALERFAGRCGAMSAEDLQEAFTRTFDMDPACSLEVGWHLHGENYARGEYLVGMRRALRGHGLAESAELPDHLSHTLAVLGRTPGGEGDRLASECANALGRVAGNMKGHGSPFEDLVEAALTAVGEVAHA